ncbi:6,7-dimethyl-8-ribityllumazine synthase [Nocardia veterana]|uniref:6,7-dimethyl-8-ribityllumazine synthase n=1 Tax=Nocardia veterana TaxID=132249 RepID=A0A7X6M2W4_9NOCA|nr:6,7-dimethyl-8-ribityllumazine synthase [Nocardia veterana]NKY89349.1 6,7-dimethyl-8-ribityllumazine synthase [Nocardia veterana]
MSPIPNRIALVAARRHADIVDRAAVACRARLAEHGYPDVEVVEAPGAFEIPLRIKRLAVSGEYAALGGCALVADGGIYRNDFVAATVVDALMRVQLDTDVPVFSAVLTPHHFHEHEEHLEYFSRHFEVKGAEPADAIATTLGPVAVPA